MTDGQSPKPQGANDGWSVVGYLIAGFAVWGGVGWLFDRWLGTQFLMPVGLIVGMASAIYLIVKRFGSSGT
jgi:F0F1-type ATP synthase assembly protein I